MPRGVPHRLDVCSRSMRRGVIVIGAAAITLALALSACGSSTSGSTMVGGETTVVAAGYAGAGPVSGDPYASVISVALGKLSQTSLTIPADSRVMFVNAEDDTKTQHRLVADDGSFDTMTLDPGGEYNVVFSGVGTVKYHDALNPDIKGEIVVTAAGSSNTGVLPLTGPWIAVGKNGLSTTKIEATVGDPVTFYNSEDDNTVNHHMVADDGSFDTGVLKPGDSYSVTFEAPGTYSFHDVLGSSIKGTITVK